MASKAELRLVLETVATAMSAGERRGEEMIALALRGGAQVDRTIPVGTTTARVPLYVVDLVGAAGHATVAFTPVIALALGLELVQLAYRSGWYPPRDLPRLH